MGLGLPSEMASYIESGISPWMYLWNPIDVGYGAAYATNELINGKTGAVGEKFSLGDLGEIDVVEDGDGT